MSSRQRSEVFAGTRKKTSGGLTKADLTKNKRGRYMYAGSTILQGVMGDLNPVCMSQTPVTTLLKRD